MKKWSLLSCALSLAMSVMPAMTGEAGTVMKGLPSSAAQRAETLEQLGIKACMPRPSVEPPPPMNDELTAQGLSLPAAGQGPCPEGLVPQPIERWEPKGRPTHGLSPALATASTGTPAAKTAAYYYSGAYQFAVGSGSSAFLTQHLPWLMPDDYHSLAEMAVQSTDLRQIVEVGWTVCRRSYGDEYPHLFVFHWVDGEKTCYNGCGWVQVSPTRFPGMRLTYDGTAHQYMIQYREGNWWIGYEGEWIGYFPGTLWNVSFTSSGIIQWFGELSAAQGETPPQSSIGNYYHGESDVPSTARMSQISLFDDTGSLQGPATLSFMNTDSAFYSSCEGKQPNEFRYGGHGAAP